MSSIPDEVIEQVRDAADPITVIGEFVDLRRTGTDYRGPCPLHGGSKRNFAVIPQKRMFYCHVCHEGGDVFSFFMKRFGLDYPHAVREVAAKVGITIPDRPTGGPDPSEPFFSAVGVAADWYNRRLRESDDAAHARRYLEERTFDLERLAPFGLGFAPKGNVFLEAMHNLGISDDVLLEAGLAVKREDNSLRPRFWGRLLFPIHDLRGRVVGFGGRALGDAEPKYLNSPESPVFHKGRLLYNLHTAKQSIRMEGRAILVEGYFDVIRSVEAGVENVVAPLGTAFSADRAQLIKRFTNEVVVFYDSDAAGMRASFRVCDELLKIGVRALIATAPPGEDPDTLVVSGGPEALRRILDDAIDVFERKLQLIERKGWFETLAGRRNALDKLLPTLRATSDNITRDLYVSRAAEVLGVTVESVHREVKTGGTTRKAPPPAEDDVPASPHRMRPERDLVNAMLHDPSWRNVIPEHLPDSSPLGQPEREVYDCLRQTPADAPIADLFDRLSPPARQMVQELMEDGWRDLKFHEVVDGAISRIQSRGVERRLRELRRQHDLVGDAEKATIQQEIVELRHKASKLNPARWPVIRG